MGKGMKNEKGRAAAERLKARLERETFRAEGGWRQPLEQILPPRLVAEGWVDRIMGRRFTAHDCNRKPRNGGHKHWMDLARPDSNRSDRGWRQEWAEEEAEAEAESAAENAALEALAEKLEADLRWDGLYDDRGEADTDEQPLEGGMDDWGRPTAERFLGGDEAVDDDMPLMDWDLPDHLIPYADLRSGR